MWDVTAGPGGDLVRQIHGLTDPQLAAVEDRAEAAMRTALQQVMDKIADRIASVQTAAGRTLWTGCHFCLNPRHPGPCAKPKAAGSPASKRKKKAPSGGGGGGKDSGEVRGSLRDAKTTDEVSAAASAEALRITGRETRFDMTGSDVQLAREHSEGVLQGLERYPGTKVSTVRMGNDIVGGEGEAIAATLGDGAGGHVIVFSHDAQKYGAASYRADLKQEQQYGFQVTGTPRGTALHEFGHAAANQYRLNGRADNKAGQYAEIDMNMRGNTREAIGKSISRYASTSSHELSAEAFADVMTNGDKASGMSRLIVSDFDTEIRLTDAEAAAEAAMG